MFKIPLHNNCRKVCRSSLQIHSLMLTLSKVHVCEMCFLCCAVCVQNGEMVSKGHSLILSGATYDMAGMYECLVTVPEIEGMETRGTLLLNVQGKYHHKY